MVSVSKKVPGEELLKSTVIVIAPAAGIVNGVGEVVNAEPEITATTFVMGIACLFSIVKLRVLVAPTLIDPKSKGAQVIVMCPTRELATQTEEEFFNLSR